MMAESLLINSANPIIFIFKNARLLVLILISHLSSYMYLTCILHVHEYVALHIGQLIVLSGVKFYQLFAGFPTMYAVTASPHRP